MCVILKASLRISLLIFVLFQNRCLQAQDQAVAAAWKKKMKSADEALEKEFFTDAKTRYEGALALAERFATNDVRRSETLTKLAFVRMRTDEKIGAEVDLRRALAIDESKFGSNDLRLAPELLRIGECCVAANRSEEADDFFNRAQPIFEKAFGKDDRVVGLCLWDRASSALLEHRYAQSEALFDHAIKLVESPRPPAQFDLERYPTLSVVAPSTVELSKIYGAQAMLFELEKKHAEAEAGLNHCLALQEHKYGKHSRMVCQTLVALADVYLIDGKLKESKEVNNRALTLLSRVSRASPVYQHAVGVQQAQAAFEKTQK